MDSIKRAAKAAVTAAALPVAGFSLSLGGAMPTAAAGLIADDAATVLHHGPTPWAMDDNLGGALCEEPKVCLQVSYQWILSFGEVEFGVSENVEALDSAIKNISADGAGDKKIVYAFSGGARVAAVWLEEHAEDADAPDADDLIFVLLGNGGRKYGGINGTSYGDVLMTPTDTQYTVIDVAREYDPIADYPDDPTNLLALANALAAFYYVHLDYSDVDLDDPGNYVWTEGTTTYVFVPTEDLPLLQGLRDLGLGWLVDDWEEPLREIIDSAYDRDYLDGVEPQGDPDTTEETSMDSELGASSEDPEPIVAATEESTADSMLQGDGPEPPITEPVESSAPQEQVDADEEDTIEEGTEEEGAGDTTEIASDTPTRGKHRAPLNGVKKATSSAAEADGSTGGTSTKSDAGPESDGSDS